MTFDEIASIGRTVLGYAAGIATGVGVSSLFSVPVSDLQTGFDHIVHGSREVLTGLSPFIALGTGIWGWIHAGLKSKVAAVQSAEPAALVQAVQAVHPVMLRDAVAAQPEVKAVVVTTSAIADASPSPKVTTATMAPSTKG